MVCVGGDGGGGGGAGELEGGCIPAVRFNID